MGDRYQIEETLGQGGAGVVYRAFDRVLQRPVAIKTLEISKGGPDQGVERLRREAALLDRLEHPNIVAFYDLVEAKGGGRSAGEEGNQPHLVLEYVAGCSLRDLLEVHQGPLPLELAHHIIRSVLEALLAAHGAGIIHRDLKPENILLAGVEPEAALDLVGLQPQVKVTDFGLAYLSGDVRITDENLVAGTALYLAPEAALGQVVDGRADLYALGLIWYELVAGRLPFQGHEPLTVISQHLYATPISPRWHNPNLPSALTSLILKLLAKTPADRYQSAEATLAELETIQYGGNEERTLTPASLLEAMARGQVIGRDQEIALLREGIEAMLHGSGGVFFIEGAAGIGKTRLVGEASLYARLKGVQVFTGHCYDADLTLPYQPFIEIVRAYVQANIKPGSPGRLPASLAAELVNLVPGLEPHLGVSPATGGGEVSPAEARLRLFEAVVALFANDPQPLMLVLENLHWASPPDLALLQHLAQNGVRYHRLLLVVTYQTPPTPPSTSSGRGPAAGGNSVLQPGRGLTRLWSQLNRAGLATHLRLQPLPAEDTTRLLEALLEGEVAAAFSQAIFEVTEGNPFFVGEMLKALIEAGRIFRDPTHGHWAGTNLENLEIPASLKEVMDQRFEKLSPSQRHLLSLAALLGRRFQFETLLAAADMAVGTPAVARTTEDEVFEALEEAARMQLVHQVDLAEDGAETYAFDHSLIRQALVENLSARQQRRLHRQIAQALEGLNEGRSRPVAPPDELAYHFGQAGEEFREKAIQYSLIAVDHALQVYANEVAVKHYQFILDLLNGDESNIAQRAWLLEQLGDLYFHRTRQLVDALATYEWAIQLWQNAPRPDTAALIRLYRHIGEVARYWQGRIERLDVYLAEALRLLDEDPTQATSLERSRVLTTIALNLHSQPAIETNYAEALNLAQFAVDLAGQLEAVAEEAMALDALQRIYRARGELAEAHQIDHRRLALIPKLQEPTEIVEAHLGGSQMGWETGDLAMATKFCLEALAMARRTDNIGGQWEALRRLVMFHLQWGKLDTAVSYASQGVALGPRAGLLGFGEPVEALFRTQLALLYTLQGQAEAAAIELAELSRLYPTQEAPPYHFALGWLHYEVEAWEEAMLDLAAGQAFPTPFLPGRFDQLLLFEVCGHLGDEFALEEIGPAAEAEAHHWHLPYYRTILQRSYGVFYTEQAAWTEAEAAFKAALATTRGKMLWYQDARTWLDYGRMLARRNEAGDLESALELLSEAQSMFVSFGAHALAEKAWIEVTRLSQ